jgi:hypothetical protein
MKIETGFTGFLVWSSAFRWSEFSRLKAELQLFMINMTIEYKP